MKPATSLRKTTGALPTILTKFYSLVNNTFFCIGVGYYLYKGNRMWRIPKMNNQKSFWIFHFANEIRRYNIRCIGGKHCVGTNMFLNPGINIHFYGRIFKNSFDHCHTVR